MGRQADLVNVTVSKKFLKLRHGTIHGKGLQILTYNWYRVCALLITSSAYRIQTLFSIRYLQSLNT